jgi:hypothetical protein
MMKIIALSVASVLVSAPAQAEWWACTQVDTRPESAISQTIRIENGTIYRYAGDAGGAWNFPQGPYTFDDDRFQEGNNAAKVLNADRATWRTDMSTNYGEWSLDRRTGGMTYYIPQFNKTLSYSCNAINDPRRR